MKKKQLKKRIAKLEDELGTCHIKLSMYMQTHSLTGFRCPNCGWDVALQDGKWRLVPRGTLAKGTSR